MNFRFRFTMWILCVTFQAAVVCLAEDVTLQAHWNSSWDHPDQIELSLGRADGGPFIGYPIVISRSAGIRNPKLFVLQSAKGGEVEDIEVTQVIVRRSLAPDADHAQRISLVVADAPLDDATYTLKLEAGALALDLPESDTLQNSTTETLTVQGDIAEHNADAHSFPENKLALEQGEDSGAVSFQWYRSRYLDEARQMAYNLGLTVDASLEDAAENNYLSKIEAEVGFYKLGSVGSGEQPWLGQRGVYQLGLSGKFQSDQDFETMDQTVGVNGWFWLNNRLFRTIYRSACLFGDKPDFALPPAIILGYDYAFHLAEGEPSTEDPGHNRIVGRLAWTLPIARNLHIEKIPLLNQIKDVNLVSDVAGIYDIDQGRAHPEVKLSLDFVLSDSEQRPTVTLSFVNGKAAPTFEQFDAFLAGFKMKF